MKSAYLSLRVQFERESKIQLENFYICLIPFSPFISVSLFEEYEAF